jgi:2-methylisocitrate lyase-like PEP mutase family enzyme
VSVPSTGASSRPDPTPSERRQTAAVTVRTVVAMSEPTPIAAFRTLHEGPDLFLIPNPWDAGSAKVLAALGFAALATTSSGHAFTLGRLDGGVTREEVLVHLAQLVDAVSIPISADLEHGYADDPAGVAETVALVAATGVAGCSIEDSTGRPDDPIFPAELAADRVRAAVEHAGHGGERLVITARAEGYLHGRPDLADAIARLQSFQEAGADCLYAPGITDLDEIRTLVSEVDRPVNVLARKGAPTIAELASVGVRRVSVGGGFAWAAVGGLVDAARELLDEGTYEFWDQAGRGWTTGRAAVS